MSDSATARKQMSVSDEVAIEIINMNKWYGAFSRFEGHQHDREPR